MVDFAPGPDPAADPERPADPDDRTPETVLTAKRVTMNEARRWFEAGGGVLVSEYGHKSTIPVGPSTTTHSRNTTTWEELRRQVNEWRGRYPNQRCYKVVAVGDPYGPDDVADLVAHDAAVGLPGSQAWAAQILENTPAGVREQIRGAAATVWLSMAATVQQVGDETTHGWLLAGLVVDILTLVHGPGKIDEFRTALASARSLDAEARRLCDEANDRGIVNNELDVRELAQEAADEALAIAAVLLS